jgi:hypothetical protein
MVEKISVAIALEGGKEVEKQLADIGEAGQKAFADISKSAEQVGGFKNLKPEEVTAKLETLGLKGTEAFGKIQNAVKTAVRWENVVQGVSAIEAGFMTVARAAGVFGVAIAAAGVALSRYTSQAAKVSEALSPLADVTGQSMQSISALQIAFAQSGTSVEKFASEFTNLAVKVQQAARTMADDVAQSSQHIAQANQNAAQSTLALARAEQNLSQTAQQVGNAQVAVLQAQIAARQQLTGLIDPSAQKQIADALQKQVGLQTQLSGTDEKRIADARVILAQRQAEQQLASARLAQQQAEQQLVAAQLAQQQALHAARVAEANDLSKNINLYREMGQGIQAAFDPLTTQATKNQALFAALAQAGENYLFVLADILKNATALERIQIAEALKLDPKTVQTLEQGSDALRAQQAAAQALGIALSDVDRTNLKAFTDSWSKLGATASAALEKLAAALAPIGTLIAEGLQVALEALIADVGRVTAVFNSLGVDGGKAFVDGLIAGFGADIEKFWASVLQNWEILKQKLSGGTPAAAGGGDEGMAGGGLIGGRGTGTSDSNLAWISRGEHIMPARAVAQPGVLAFLEALRRSGGNLARVLDGMSRFALGGLVPRPALAFAGGGLVGGMSNVTIQFPGLPAIGGLRASTEVVGELQRAAALAQVRSGGRKPSRYS